MNCPKCGYGYSRIIDSREKDGIRKRRRECSGCGHRYNGVEISEEQYIKAQQLANMCFEFAETIKKEIFGLGKN